MINVYSFQKMISQQQIQANDKKNSNTSQFSFGQNYKKIITNSKVSFDFRKFLQKNHHYRKNIAHRQQQKRLPLQQVASQNNTQNLLTNKAFKIRCYTKKNKQNEKTQSQQNTIEKQQQKQYITRSQKYRPKIYEMKNKKAQSSILNKKNQIIDNSSFSMKLHKFDNYDLLQPISCNIKMTYNPLLVDLDKNYSHAIIFDIDFLINSIKSSLNCPKTPQKQRQFYRKKIIIHIKRLIQQSNIDFPLQRLTLTRIQQTTQIIFKVKKQQQVNQLLKQLQICQFKYFYGIFFIQQKFVQSINVYNLMKIDNLAQNIIILDDHENIFKNIPLINSCHFIAYSTIQEKSNFNTALQNFYNSIENTQIRFSACQFEDLSNIKDFKQGKVIELPFKQLLQRVKQKLNQRSLKKMSRSKKQRCQSSYQNTHNQSIHKKDQKNLQIFKQKLLKYLKIISNQSQAKQKQLRKSKQLQNMNDDLKQQFDCITGRQTNSKTNNQLVSELIRLNSNVNKQINGYLNKNQEICFAENQQYTISFLENQYVRNQKIYVNHFS